MVVTQPQRWCVPEKNKRHRDDHSPAASDGDHTTGAHASILAAARDQHGFGGRLAVVLASAAPDLGSSALLVAGRAGSWEADLVWQLVKSTAGWADDYLCKYRSER
jgi:hypothetical protein